MQITHAEVIPVDLKLRHPTRMARLPEMDHIQAIFVRLETRQGHNAWGCAVAQPAFTGETPAKLLEACHACAAKAPDLHPTNLEYSLNELAQAANGSPGALCAFDLAFHDLLGLAAGLPLYRLLGGYRSSIPTSVTIPLGSIEEAVSLAKEKASLGFRILKIKGGIDPEEDLRRVQAVHRALPALELQLDADGGYSVQSAIEIARALHNLVTMIEQPTAPEDLDGLKAVTADMDRLQLPILIIADQSLSSPNAALQLAANRISHGICVKVAQCGGLRCARQVDSIARATHSNRLTHQQAALSLATVVSCVIEPALLISAGLSLALSSPNVRFCDLDGHLELEDDPSQMTFKLENGWLTASEVPGLGCAVPLD
jgi:L-alanine-DL-glutamate epimerase-like enolase superfamily enzyme